MINGSIAFNNAVDAGGYPYIVRISENGAIIDCTISACTSVKGSTGGEAFGVGTVFVPYVELEVVGLNRALENADILVEVGVQINPTTTEWINLGYYRVSKIQASTVRANVTAVGRITAILGIVPTLSGTITIASLISAIQSAVRNAGFSTFTINYSGLTLSNETITSDLSGKTCRQLLEIIASIVGCYATEDSNGNVVLFKYNTSSTISYDGSRMITHPVVNDSNFSLNNIKVIKTPAYELDDGTVVPEVSYQYSTSLPLNWIMVNSFMENQSMFNTFCSNCLGLSYRPSTVVLASGDPRIEATDVLTITDTNGAVYTVPGFSVINVLTGGITTTIVAPGETETEADTSAKGPISQQIDILSSSVVTAQTSANLASAAAEAARTAAGQANELLDGMRQSAEEAGTTLTQIYSDAESAKVSAEEARRSASGAQYSLSELEQVMGALTWIAEHATYEITEDDYVISGKFYFNVSSASLTTDTTIDKRKAYYTLSNGVYTYVENPVVADIGTYYEVIFGNVTPQVNPSLQGYYELSSSTFALSADTSVVDGKTYYIKNTSGGQTWYEPVINPTGDPSDEGWYELTSATYVLSSDTSVQENKLYFTYDSDTSRYIVITEYEANPALLGLYELGDVETSISNYIASHVSLDNDGLVIQTDDIDTKVRVSGKGVQLTNELGIVIATFSEDVRLGNANGTHITLSPVNGLGFYQGTEDENDPSVNRVAYINYDTLFINQAEIVSKLRIGDFVWKVQTNRISLVYAP